ncbi:MAG TPA: MFS transporter, partial [Candidatus Saccharimonadales bacterium]|nr:MFS transporter [Candidatus Saccharimonadales bacterium]
GAGSGILLSGFLAHEFGFRFNFRIALIPTLISLSFSLLLTEPSHHKKENDVAKLKAAIKESASTIRRSSPLIATAMLLLTVRTFQWMSDNYSQLAFNKFGIQLSLMGVVSFLAVGGGAIGRLVAHRFASHARAIVLIMIGLFACTGFAPEPVALVGFITFYGFNQLLENICETDIQIHLPSHIRATATSVFSFFSTLLVIPFGLITGVLIRQYDVLAAFKLATVLGALTLGWWLIKGSKNLLISEPSNQPPTDLMEPIQ